ncbi:MAG: acyltransferase family protein [Verrucomicrobiales bacterium]|nr:acyltransferase [Verrucomicrobiota bacterium JB025]
MMDETDAVPHGRGQRRSRLDAIEWIRIVAACGVIWFHVPGGGWKDVGQAGLVCFLLITFVFQATGAARDEWGDFLKKRVRRILPPWCFWFAVYGVLNLVKGNEWFPFSSGWAANLFTGPWIGLWYLPFITLCAPLVYGLVGIRRMLNPYAESALFAAAGIGGLLFLSTGPVHGWAGETPWAQWLQAGPSVLIALGMRAVLGLGARVRVAVMAGFVLAQLVACGWIWPASRGVAVSYGLAVPVVAAGLLIPWRLPAKVTAAGGLCLCVYLVHAAVIAVLRMLPALADRPDLVFPLAVVLAFAAAWVMTRLPVLGKFC